MTDRTEGHALARFVARTDPCNRVWIEDAEHGRFMDDGGICINFPQHPTKRTAKRILELAEKMAAAPETERQRDLLLKTVKALVERVGYTGADTSQEFSDARAAIAECEPEKVEGE